MSEQIDTFKSYIEGPRWACIPTYLRKLAIIVDVEIDVNVDKGFLRETVFYEVTGTESKLQKFKKIFAQSIKEYGKD